MKKQNIIVGVIILLVVVIIALVLIGTNWLSGETSIKDIVEHGNKYANQTVTVRGIYNPTYIPGLFGDHIELSVVFTITDSSGNTIMARESNDIVKPTPLVSGSQYKFTGIVSYDKATNEAALDQVTKIEKV